MGYGITSSSLSSLGQVGSGQIDQVRSARWETGLGFGGEDEDGCSVSGERRLAWR